MIERLYVVTCDGCHASLGAPHYSERAALAAMASAGWEMRRVREGSRAKRRVVCAGCVSKAGLPDPSTPA